MRETAKAAAAYEQYCALGDERSLTTLAEQRWLEAGGPGRKESAIHTMRNQLGIWSVKYGWQERVKLYDREQAQKKRKQREKELEKLNEDQAKYAQVMSTMAMKQIQTLIQAKAFNGNAAVQLYKFAQDIERQARGGNQEHHLRISGDPDNPVGPTTEIINNVLIYLPEKDQKCIPGVHPKIVEGEIE